MGACNFNTTSKGRTVEQAYNDAVEAANYEYGHGGYTGEINVKSGYVLFPLPKGMTAEEVDELLVEATWDDEARAKLIEAYRGVRFERFRTLDGMIATWDDKWGPAVCFQTGPDTFYFCGMAST